MQTECLVCGLGSYVEGDLVWQQNRNLDGGVMQLILESDSNAHS